MRDTGGGGLTFAVLVEQVERAARDVRAVTSSAQAGAVEGLPTGVEVGHARLTEVLFDFCARWDTGLSHLVGDSTAMADALDATAADYVAREDAAETHYRRARTTGGPTAYGGEGR